jgi:hypothetical protein
MGSSPRVRNIGQITFMSAAVKLGAFRRSAAARAALWAFVYRLNNMGHVQINDFGIG